MTSGELDRRITIEAPVATHNAANEPVDSFEDLATVWAKRMDASAREAYRAQEVGGEITARFTIRWSSEVAGIDARHRVSFDSKSYNITAVREIGRNQWLEIDAVARAQESDTYDS